jgi:hypothetical protein
MLDREFYIRQKVKDVRETREKGKYRSGIRVSCL